MTQFHKTIKLLGFWFGFFSPCIHDQTLDNMKYIRGKRGNCDQKNPSSLDYHINLAVISCIYTDIRVST